MSESQPPAGGSSISIIIPALNEEQTIQETLQRLQPMRQRGVEVILVDGGSRDRTAVIAAPLIDQLIESDRAGRAIQMNCGARAASGALLWFLHADTLVPEEGERILLWALRQHPWGRFNVRLSGRNPLLRVVEWMMNHRSCWSGIATGDQAIFLPRTLFERVGGFPEIPLMEDIALSKRLKRIGRPFCVAGRVITSSRRWEERGIIRTILLMWGVRLGYWVGISPQRLSRIYR